MHAGLIVQCPIVGKVATFEQKQQGGGGKMQLDPPRRMPSSGGADKRKGKPEMDSTIAWDLTMPKNAFLQFCTAINYCSWFKKDKGFFSRLVYGQS